MKKRVVAERFGSWTVTSLLVLLCASTAVATDLTGHWRVLIPDGPDHFVDIVQTGSAVSLTLDVSGYVFDGSLSGSDVSASSDDLTCPTADLALELRPNESFLDGTLIEAGTGCGFGTKTRKLLSRCECFDGNLIDGDGCDAECRVEPCFDCSGEPSTCTPLSDGAACDDRHDCTTGETCTAGVCGGGSALTPPCIDLTGLWRIKETSSFFGTFYSREDLRQRDGILTSRNVPGGEVGDVGTIDASTGAMNRATPTTLFPICSGFQTFSATVAADGATYDGTGQFFSQTPLHCVAFGYTELGTRCGGGSLDAGEACDDGNPDNGDGCDINCAVEPCFQCSGDPSVCTPLPDSTPCLDGDPCTLAGSCSAGACIVSSTLECGPCTVCDGAGGCEPGPRNDCRASTDPSVTRLQLNNLSPDTKDSLRWVWKKGALVNLSELGNPATTSSVALCLFEESGAEPNLIFNATVPPGGSCTTPPCWKQTANGTYIYRDRGGAAAGITSIKLKSGVAGKSSVILRGKGVGLAASPLGLPIPTLPLPLRAQVQISDGACFEGTYEAADVRKNADGILRAHGSP